MGMSTKSDDPYDIKVTQDPTDPTLVHVTMKLPAGMVARSEPGLIDLPENPTIQSTEEARKRLSDALSDGMTRGNVRHENTPDPRLPTPEQIEAARKSILEAEDERILAEMRQANVPEWDESVDPKKLAYPDGTPEEHARKLGALIKATLPADDPRNCTRESYCGVCAVALVALPEDYEI